MTSRSVKKIHSAHIGHNQDGEIKMNRMMKWFHFEHLPEHLRGVSKNCYELAASIDAQIPECAEKTAGLRKLLEAKDCFVRAKLEAGGG